MQIELVNLKRHHQTKASKYEGVNNTEVDGHQAVQSL